MKIAMADRLILDDHDCPRCGVLVSGSPWKMCEGCRAKRREHTYRQREARTDKGNCVDCNRRAPLRGRARCAVCLEQHKILGRIRRENRRRALRARLRRWRY